MPDCSTATPSTLLASPQTLDALTELCWPMPLTKKVWLSSLRGVGLAESSPATLKRWLAQPTSMAVATRAVRADLIM